MKSKKSYSHIRQNKVKDKISFVNKFKDSYPVEIMCKVLELNRSTYYKDSKRKLTKTQINNELDSKILKVYYDSKRRYGAPKIYKVLRNEGETASLKRIQRRMTVLGIKSVVVNKYKPVKAEKNIEQRENILNQDFSATLINQKWSTDITYIHTENEGWTYLDSVEDLYSRKIIGWAFGKTIDAELAVRTLKNAVGQKEKKTPLSEVIKKINEEFGTKFTERDKVIFTDIFNSMVKDDKLKTSARSNGEQMFSNNIMPKSFDDTLQKSYFENMEAYESWLKDKEKYEFMRKMMAEALYKAFLKDIEVYY